MRWVVLVIGLLAIFQWQRTFFEHRFPQNTLQTFFYLEASGGILEWQAEFVYFLYYTGLVPVVASDAHALKARTAFIAAATPHTRIGDPPR